MNIDQMTLASRLKDARTTANMTQEQVAKALDLPRTAVVQLEAGNRAVSTLELAKLAQLYGRPISSFFEAAPPREEEDALVALFRAAQVEVAESQRRVSTRLGLATDPMIKFPVFSRHVSSRSPSVSGPASSAE